MRPIMELCSADDLPVEEDRATMPHFEGGHPGSRTNEPADFRSLLEHPEALSSAAAWWRGTTASSRRGAR